MSGSLSVGGRGDGGDGPRLGPGTDATEHHFTSKEYDAEEWGCFMKDGFTRLALILDRSGSMASIEEATVAGVNKFIEEQKRVPGTATLKLVQFDDVYEEVFDTPIAEAPELTLSKTPKPGQRTYEPRGSTALLDAIGRTVTELGTALAAMPEEERPCKVIVIIMTDGLENASKVFTAPQVFDLIVQQRDIYKWDFVYLGANQDAIATAAKMGIAAASAMPYAANRTATTNAVNATSAAVRRSRSSGQNVSYTSQERKAAVVEDKGDKPA
jgi:hypothetical protein